MATQARILRIEAAATTGTQRILLEIAGGYHFHAGQYLTVLHPDGTAIPLSIASAPDRLPQLVLHYRSTPGVAEAAAMDSLLPTGMLRVSDAAGDVICPDPAVSLLIVAGGSGVAQAFSCVEHRHRVHGAPENGKQPPGGDGADPLPQAGPTTLLWCADDPGDIYESDYLMSLGVEFVPIVDDRRTPENEGLVWLADHAERFADHHIIIAGGPGFVYEVTDLLSSQGIARDQLHADAYAYAPRAK